MNVQTPLVEVSLSRAETRSAYLSHLLKLAQDNAQPGWTELRDRAVDQVQAQAFPTTRDEEWRFTDLSGLLQLPLSLPDPVDLSAEAIAPWVASDLPHRLVFVNGQFSPALSNCAGLPEKLTIGTLSSLEAAPFQPYLGQQSGNQELFTALNTAGLSDAAIVWVPRGLAVEQPIHLLWLQTASQALIQPRALVIAEANSQITIAEEYATIGEAAYFTNAVTEIFLADNAQVNHTRLQRESIAAFHIGKTAVSQARTSRYVNQSIGLGGLLSRHNLEIDQTGEQTETVLNGLVMLRQQQTGDLHSTIALTQPYGTTRQVQKCIVDDRAHGVFNGKVYVPQKAQQTDAGQLNRNLLLSPNARVDTKPQLEIVADNVKCTHGATVGQIDRDELFYLQSRGIDSHSARRLLVYAFAYEILDQVPIDSLKQSLTQAIAAQL